MEIVGRDETLGVMAADLDQVEDDADDADDAGRVEVNLVEMECHLTTDLAAGGDEKSFLAGIPQEIDNFALVVGAPLDVGGGVGVVVGGVDGGCVDGYALLHSFDLSNFISTLN